MNHHLHSTFPLSLVVFLVLAPSSARAQQGGNLTSEEVIELRDAQDPSQRIKVYLALAQKRLNRLEGLQETPPAAQENLGGQVDELLGEYISIDDQLKNWIQYQYDRDGDMRSGLRELLKYAPAQLQSLQHMQNSPSPAARDYSESLRDAIADLNDTIDGANQALASQEKKFPAMKAEAKADTRTLKKEQKEVAKQNKKERKLNEKERKLRKKHHKKDATGDSGEN
jgi:chromosome segregation ATPase